ncbi:hypothetical protein D9613_006056 [Agrocybe pediades]|uniref:Sas10 C-terminal domain-containing protein n=1 Tax=Agrocybe pediades TaxID=84607 RepID=A0A8H4QVF2_9AGAR|nr:hypothetical protein D9613_006056 [Agrocybe pediades]
MPRRPSKLRRETKKPKPLKRSDGKINKWNTRDDIPMDEEDQFHESRDKILLEGDGPNGYDDDGDDDEVFALKGLEESESDEEDIHDFQEDEEEAEEAAPEPKKSKKSKKDKGKKKKKDEGEESDKEEDELEESWGKGKAAYYSSNADQLDTDDEEGNELEEQESKRLQAKMREEMADDDFGLADIPDLETTNELEQPVEEAEVNIPDPSSDKKTLLRHLEKTSPEALALARDWDDTVQSLEKTRQKIEQLKSGNPDILSAGMLHLQYQALLSYSTTLAFYLHLRSSAKYSRRPALLQSHPILQRLLSLKQHISTLEGLELAPSDSEDYDSDESEFSSMNTEEMMEDGMKLWDRDNEDLGDLEDNELNDLLEDAEEDVEEPEPAVRKPPKKKRKTEKAKAKDEPVKPMFDLVEPEFTSSRPSSSRRQPVEDAADAFGEATALHSVDAADKSARKKSLRFHTSKIESASARRQGARNQAAGGDDDIPYRERKREKDARLVKEAAIRAKNQVGVPLDDEEPQVGDKRSRDEDDDGGAESPDEYYELVKKKSQDQKAKKKAEYEEAHGLERVPLEEGGSTGPRSLTRAILTNRGLTPHRPKSVRNPRVKKRERYEKAKKKLASQKPIYKGGLSETGGKYGGEKSGISKVVKSVRLG